MHAQGLGIVVLCPLSCRAESEGGDGPGGVPGVVPAGGGDAGVAGRFQESDGEVTWAAMTWGPLPVRIWEASSP